MGFVTWISEGWSVFVIYTLEVLFVAQAKIFLDLSRHEDSWDTGDSLSMSLDTACEVRQGWAPLSEHKARALSALWGGPSRSACSEDDWHMWVNPWSPFSLPEQSGPGTSRRKWHWEYSGKEGANITDASGKTFLHGLMPIIILPTLANPFLFFVP